MRALSEQLDDIHRNMQAIQAYLSYQNTQYRLAAVKFATSQQGRRNRWPAVRIAASCVSNGSRRF